MTLTSDLILDRSLFDPQTTPQSTAELNDSLVEIQKRGPTWFEVGAAKYREMRWNGQTTLPKPAILQSGMNLSIPSRESGRAIPCRVFKPEKENVRGIFMHIHGGGWVLQSEHYQDNYLKFLADNSSLMVISVGYRLAPEHPFPAGPEDCYDAADHFIKNGKQEFGGDLQFIGGESAGGHLSVLTSFHILKCHPGFSIKGLLLHFGAYDLSAFLPALHNFPRPLVIDYTIMSKYIEVFLPNTTESDRRDPAISPFYADLKSFGWGKLPPALFTVGTEDPLLDDSIYMATKWQMAGSDTILKVYPGAPHGFILFPEEVLESAGLGLQHTKEFISRRIV